MHECVMSSCCYIVENTILDRSEKREKKKVRTDGSERAKKVQSSAAKYTLN
jgi:hypothetical protein